MNVILIGFMGCGKSTVGIRLSYFLKQPLLDTDKMIEKKAGCSISDIFAKQGEEAFRAMETECLLELVSGRGSYVISTGGGLPMREENAALLKKLGKTVFLRVRPETVYKRLRHDTARPLLKGDDPEKKIRELLSLRQAKYEACADVTVDVDDKSFEQIVREIGQQV